MIKILGKNVPKWIIALALIFLLALTLRVMWLAEIPPGIYCDEASNAYNSYSILLTGKDEHGSFMPLYFKAFGEYKNPVYIYSSIPFIALFGLNPFSARLPAAVIGSLTVLAAFLLASKIAGKKAGLLAAFFLAISPWQFIFSRIAFEAITLPLFLTLGLYFLLRAKEKIIFGVFAATSFSLAIYSYGIAYIFIPLFLTAFTLLNFHEIKKIKKHKKELAVFLLVFLLLVSPLLLEYAQESDHIKSIRGRGRYSSIFSPALIEEKEKNNEHYSIPETYASNYLFYFSPKFLFQEGDPNLRHSIPGKGVLFLSTFFLSIFGIIYCIKKKTPATLMLVFWLLAFPVAAASSIQQPHAIRSITALPVFELLAGIGTAFLFSKWKKEKNQQTKKAFQIVLIAAILLISIESFSFYSLYFTDYPTKAGPWFQEGYEQAFAFAQAHPEFEKVYFLQDLSKEYDQPYILHAFFTKLDPATLREGKETERYEFLKTPKNLEPNSLYISRPGKGKGTKIGTIHSVSGKPVMEIGRT